jgi:hypothetical protein
LVTVHSMSVYILIENQQVHHNNHFIVMSSRTLLHVSAYLRHHQTAHIIPTSYLYVGVHYRKNKGVSNKLAPVSIVTLWIQVVMTNCCWKQWTVVEHGPRCNAHWHVRSLWGSYELPDDGVSTPKHVGAFG